MAIEYHVWDYDLSENGHEVVEPNRVRQELDLLAKDGWELVSTAPYCTDGEGKTDGILYHFKRIVP